MKFLFVDEENAYESQIAAAVANDLFSRAGHDITASSRGLAVPEGKRVSEFTRTILIGIDIELKEEQMIAKSVSQEDIDEADVVMTMTGEQKEMLKNVCPPEKLFTFLEYTSEVDQDVMSPKGHALNAYQACIYGMGEAFGNLMERWEDEQM